ncbi:Mur ligase family protein [Patescibacteria group bacterium]
MIGPLSSIWFIRQAKIALFYLYLWQLKEYHLGRFLAHFQTEKGKKLILNKLSVFKIFLVLMFFVSFSLFFFLLLALYLLEAVWFFKNLFHRKLKKPVLTLKTSFLIVGALILQIIFLFLLFKIVKEVKWFVFYLLILDVFLPLIVSVFVLLLEPLTVFLRNRILRKAAQKRESLKNLTVIGITGSYGKTSTKEFLAVILEKKYNVLKTKEHQNSEIGISQCILNDLTKDHEIFIVEMGAYNKGGIKLLCDIAKPKIGILTGINEQHLAIFGSQENIIKTKYELIEALPENGIAFFNGKNKYCLDLYQKELIKIKKILYGKEAKFPGEENILVAVAVARELRMNEDEISKAVKEIKNVFPGIEIKKGKNGANIIDATFSANPDGVIAHLEYLKNWQGKKIMVMPCLIELGKASKKVHQRIGRKIGEVCDLAIITEKECYDDIKKAAVEYGMKEKAVLFLQKPNDIFEKIKYFNGKEDVILLESRISKELIDKMMVV